MRWFAGFLIISIFTGPALAQGCLPNDPIARAQQQAEHRRKLNEEIQKECNDANCARSLEEAADPAYQAAIGRPFPKLKPCGAEQRTPPSASAENQAQTEGRGHAPTGARRNSGEPQFQLTGIYDNGSHFTAVIKVMNNSNQPLGIALSSKQFASGEAYLRDQFGDQCQAIANGEETGSLKYVRDSSANDAGNYTFTSAGDDSHQTIFFWKGRCASRITSGRNASLDIDLIVNLGGRISHRTLSWTGPIVVP
jgi:hypothetical protein